MGLLDRYTLSNDWLRSTRVRIGPPVRWALSSLRGSWGNKRIARPPRAELVEVINREGLRLAARLYRGAAGGPAPGVLLLHGWDPLGQQHGFYLALAAALLKRGLNVMSFNLRGYPGSEAPATMDGFRLADFIEDIRAVATSFSHSGHLDSDRLCLYGHSYGACMVLPALAAGGSMFAKGVVHGPSIWIEQRITGPAAAKVEFFHERYWRYMQLDRPVPLHVYLKLHEQLDMLNQVKTFPSEHPGLLLVDAEHDYPGTHGFMRTLLERITAPIEYYSVPGSDHFCNSAAWGGYVLYDDMAVGALADRMVSWLAWT